MTHALALPKRWGYRRLAWSWVVFAIFLISAGLALAYPTSRMIVIRYIQAIRESLRTGQTVGSFFELHEPCLYAKSTPNYEACAGFGKKPGLHRIQVGRDGASVGLFYKHARYNKQEEATGSVSTKTLPPFTTAILEEPKERIIVFRDQEAAVSMQYRLRYTGIQQEIIFASTDIVPAFIDFALDYEGLDYENVKGSGVWYFKTPAGRNVMRFPRGWAEDAGGMFTNDVVLSITDTPHTNPVLTLSLPVEWLASSDRVFPVKVITNLEVVPEARNASVEE